VSNVVHIRRGDTVADLWEQYRALAAEAIDNRSLAVDHEHCKRTMRAWKRWSDAFIAEDQRG